MAKLEQLWDIAIKAVEAEKRARKAELQLDAALSAMTGATEQADEDGDQKPSAALTSKDQRNILNTGGLGDRRKCLPADICYDDEYLLKKEEEQRRFYNPYLCNAGIFRRKVIQEGHRRQNGEKQLAAYVAKVVAGAPARSQSGKAPGACIHIH